ncbi:hypothetical protein [Methylobacterium sp. sgz302541]|uniref:hypothetical protein n=1 Tax=unclassified Methylobacterium TaxID=2615210 RepID=UPI003D32BFEC
MEHVALDIATARTLVSALVVVAVTVFSLAAFEQGIRHMVSDMRAGAAKPTPSDR